MRDLVQKRRTKLEPAFFVPLCGATDFFLRLWTKVEAATHVFERSLPSASSHEIELVGSAS